MLACEHALWRAETAHASGVARRVRMPRRSRQTTALSRAPTSLHLCWARAPSPAMRWIPMPEKIP